MENGFLAITYRCIGFVGQHVNVVVSITSNVGVDECAVFDRNLDDICRAFEKLVVNR